MSRISGLLGRQLQGKEGKEGKGFRCKSASVRNRAARFPRSYDPLDLPLEVQTTLVSYTLHTTDSCPRALCASGAVVGTVSRGTIRGSALLQQGLPSDLLEGHRRNHKEEDAKPSPEVRELAPR